MQLHLAFYIGDFTNDQATAIDRLVCLTTWSRVSHVELVLDIENGWSVSSSPRDGGVRYTHIHYDPKHWILIPIEVNTTLEELNIWFQTQEGVPYDYVGAIGSVIPFFPESYNKWFCSELIMTFLNDVLAKQGISSEFVPRNTHPAKLLKLVEQKRKF